MLRAVVLDFDYTLADSSAGAVDCINFALREMGFEPVAAQIACRTIGLSLAETFRVLTSISEGNQAARFARLFIKRADEVMAESTSLFEWAPGAIDALKEAGLRLGIVSTKYRRRIEAILDRHRILDRFDVIVGGEDVSEHKPHPEGLERALARIGVLRAEAVYAGDSTVDAVLANRAGVRFIAVLSGTTSREAFEPFRPERIIDTVADLPPLISGCL